MTGLAVITLPRAAGSSRPARLRLWAGRAAARLMALAALATVTLAVGLAAGARPAAAASGDTDPRPVLAFMRSIVGKPYVWGATGPGSYDCSGAVQAAYRTVGISLPRTTQEQVNAGTAVGLHDWRPGDLLFSIGAASEHGTPAAPGHVGMYVGNHQVIEAKGRAYGVVVSSLAEWKAKTVAVRRPGRWTPTATLISQAAAKEGLPRPLLAAQINQESGGDPTISSPYADGIAQFTPASWASWGRGGDVWDPKDALPAMARFDAALVKANGGNVDLALAAYNAGQGAVNRYHGMPPYRETKNYVASIEAAAGLSGHITLHPVVDRSLPAQIGHEIGHTISHPLPAPAVPRNPTQFVHDVGTGLLLVVLILWLLRRNAPGLRRLAASLSTPPRRPARRASAGYAARAFSAAAVRHAARRTPPRRPRARLIPDQRGSRGTAGRGSGRAGAPHAIPRPSGRGAGWRWARAGWASARGPRPGTSAAGPGRGSLVAALARLAAVAVRGLASWLRGVPARHTVAGPRASAQPRRGPTPPRPPAQPPPDGAGDGPTAGRATDRPELSRRPDPVDPALVVPHPVPQGGLLMARTRAPIDIDWSEYLTDPGFAHLLRAPAGFEGLDYSDGPTVVATMVYLDKLATQLSQAAETAALEISRRGFSHGVAAGLQGAAEAMSNAADYYRSAAWALRENHPDLFELRVSKPVNPIGA